MIHSYMLTNGTTMVLCGEHKALAKDRIVTDLGRQTGAKWKCRVCTIHRRLIGEATDPLTALVGNHVITKYPTGVVRCDCMAWQFQKEIAPAARSCKHTVQVDWSKVARETASRVS